MKRILNFDELKVDLFYIVNDKPDYDDNYFEVVCKCIGAGSSINGSYIKMEDIYEIQQDTNETLMSPDWIINHDDFTKYNIYEIIKEEHPEFFL